MNQLHHLLVTFQILPYLPTQSLKQNATQRVAGGKHGPHKYRPTLLSDIGKYCQSSMVQHNILEKLEEQDDAFTGLQEANCKRLNQQKTEIFIPVVSLRIHVVFCICKFMWQRQNFSKAHTCTQQIVHNHNPIMFRAYSNTTSWFSSDVASRRLFCYKLKGL